MIHSLPSSTKTTVIIPNMLSSQYYVWQSWYTESKFAMPFAILVILKRTTKARVTLAAALVSPSRESAQAPAGPGQQTSNIAQDATRGVSAQVPACSDQPCPIQPAPGLLEICSRCYSRSSSACYSERCPILSSWQRQQYQLPSSN